MYKTPFAQKDFLAENNPFYYVRVMGPRHEKLEGLYELSRLMAFFLFGFVFLFASVQPLSKKRTHNI